MIRCEGSRPSILDYKETYVGKAPLPSATDTLLSRILSIPLSAPWSLGKAGPLALPPLVPQGGPKVIAIMPGDRIRVGRSLPGILPRISHTTWVAR